MPTPQEALGGVKRKLEELDELIGLLPRDTPDIQTPIGIPGYHNPSQAAAAKILEALTPLNVAGRIMRLMIDRAAMH